MKNFSLWLDTIVKLENFASLITFGVRMLDDASLRPLFMARYIKRNGPGCYVKRKVSNIGVTRRRYFLRAVSGIN